MRARQRWVLLNVRGDSCFFKGWGGGGQSNTLKENDVGKLSTLAITS